MCQGSYVTSASSGGEILPFMRTASSATPDREPPSRSAAHLPTAPDCLSECRAMVGLALLAAESLPPAHAVQLEAVLRVVHTRLGVALHTLCSGHGQPPLAPVEV